MKSIAAWCFGGAGTYLEAQNFEFIRVSMPEVMQWSEAIQGVATTIGAVVGLVFLWVAYKLKKAEKEEVEARTKNTQLSSQLLERQLAEDNTTNIVMRVLKELKE